MHYYYYSLSMLSVVSSSSSSSRSSKSNLIKNWLFFVVEGFCVFFCYGFFYHSFIFARRPSSPSILTVFTPLIYLFFLVFHHLCMYMYGCVLCVLVYTYLCTQFEFLMIMKIHFKVDRRTTHIQMRAKQQRIQNITQTLRVLSLCSFSTGNRQLI